MDQIHNFMAFVGLPNSQINRVIAAYFIYTKQGLNSAVNEYYSKPNTVSAIRSNVAMYSKYYDYFQERNATGMFSMNSSDAKKVIDVFNLYKEDQVNAFGMEYIGIDGTFKYLNDLGIEPEEVDALVLAYYVNAKEVGVFEREDFVSGWCNVDIYDLQSMSQFIKNKSIDIYKNDSDLFARVYKFTFGYVLDKQDKSNIQKQLPLEEAIEYWKLLIPNSNSEMFFNWLENESNRKTIKRDEWNMLPSFLQLAKDGETNLISRYSEDDAWPLLMDDYVEYLVDNV